MKCNSLNILYQNGSARAAVLTDLIRHPFLLHVTPWLRMSVVSSGYFIILRAFLLSQYARATSYIGGFAFQQRKEVLMANITATVPLKIP